MKYYYPKNLISKPKLAFWHIKDILIGSGLFLISIFIFVKLMISLPLILSLVYLILTIRIDEFCFFDLLKNIFKYFSNQKIFFNTKETIIERIKDEKENNI